MGLGEAVLTSFDVFLAKIFKICIYNAWASFRNVTQLITIYTYVVGVHEQMSQQADVLTAEMC